LSAKKACEKCRAPRGIWPAFRSRLKNLSTGGRNVPIRKIGWVRNIKEMTKLYFASDDALVALTIKGRNAECGLHLRGNKIACVSVDPLCPPLVYCGTFGSGLWSSDNAGESWRPAGKGVRHTKVQSVTVSRSERIKGRGVVYAGTEPSAVFRSEDGGETWEECGIA